MKWGGIIFLAILLLPSTTYAAEMIYKDSKPTALIGLSEKWVSGDHSGCENRSGSFEVQEIVYDGTSEIVSGIRVTPVTGFFDAKDRTVPLLIRLDTKMLSNVDRGWIPTLVNRGNRLLIEYDVCGSGGFSSAQNIYTIDDNNYLSRSLLFIPILAFLYLFKKRSKNKTQKKKSNKDGGSQGEAYNAESPLTRAKAFEILGLKEGATKKEIREARKRLLKGLHPDTGGSNTLASLINQAADFLLK